MAGELRELDETRTCLRACFLVPTPLLFGSLNGFRILYLFSDNIALKAHSFCIKEGIRLVLHTSYTYTPFNIHPRYRSFNHFALSLNNSQRPLKQQKRRQSQRTDSPPLKPTLFNPLHSLHHSASHALRYPPLSSSSPGNRPLRSISQSEQPCVFSAADPRWCHSWWLPSRWRLRRFRTDALFGLVPLYAV